MASTLRLPTLCESDTNDVMFFISSIVMSKPWPSEYHAELLSNCTNGVTYQNPNYGRSFKTEGSHLTIDSDRKISLTYEAFSADILNKKADSEKADSEKADDDSEKRTHSLNKTPEPCTQECVPQIIILNNIKVFIEGKRQTEIVEEPGLLESIIDTKPHGECTTSFPCRDLKRPHRQFHCWVPKLSM